MASKYPTQYNAELGITKTPILLVQAPPAPDERRFYQHILSTIGAPMWGRHTVSELEVRALSHLRDMDLKMLMIDEVHNLLAGSYREQRRFLNMLRFLANDLCASLVVFGVNEALEADRGDDQLARRLDEHYLPLWDDDVEFSRLIQTLIAAMALEQRSGLTVASLRTILKVTGGITSRVFIMTKSLAIEAIKTGEERITDEAVQSWQQYGPSTPGPYGVNPWPSLGDPQTLATPSIAGTRRTALELDKSVGTGQSLLRRGPLRLSRIGAG